MSHQGDDLLIISSTRPPIPPNFESHLSIPLFTPFTSTGHHLRHPSAAFISNTFSIFFSFRCDPKSAYCIRLSIDDDHLADFIFFYSSLPLCTMKRKYHMFLPSLLFFLFFIFYLHLFLLFDIMCSVVYFFFFFFFILYYFLPIILIIFAFFFSQSINVASSRLMCMSCSRKCSSFTS